MTEKRELQQRVEELICEKAQYIQRTDQQTHQLQQQIQHQQGESENQLAKKEEIIQMLERERLQLWQQNQNLQLKLDSAPEGSVSQFTQVQIPRQDQDSWNVQRREVVLNKKVGQGAWGTIHKGVFRGQKVAVKCAHEDLLHTNTIDQLKREIRIMAHVQHPNLVRLIAAVVDESVERRTESPLLVLELMDTDLRLAYQKRVVDLKRETLVSIFQDVAYALHYLHERHQPIIHRDVSAPNVLLKKDHGVWRAKLSDFGSANLAKYCKTIATGAVIYSAPETFPPRDPYNPPKQTTKIDVYSYGYLMAESIAKEMPSPENRVMMLLKISREWAPMHDIITACTEYEPERRLTMTQVLEKLHSMHSMK